MSELAFTLREARPSDVPGILTLIRELAEYEKQPEDCHAEEAALARHLFGEKRFAEVVLAEAAGEPIGFALFFHSYSTWLTQPGISLEDLFVKPDSRGLGVGKALLAHLARLAIARGCGRVEWSVLTWNAPAIGFYERLGAVPMTGWQVYRLTGDALERLGR